MGKGWIPRRINSLGRWAHGHRELGQAQRRSTHEHPGPAARRPGQARFPPRADGVDRPIVSIDGKTTRRGLDAKEDLSALHVVAAWAADYGLALGQEVCVEKSYEITAIPELLKKIDVRDSMPVCAGPAGNLYLISISAGTLASNNYSFTSSNSELTVPPAPLTITANNQSKVYGTALPTLTTSDTNFVNGDASADSATSPFVTTTAATASSVSGNTYQITLRRPWFTVKASFAWPRDRSRSLPIGFMPRR